MDRDNELVRKGAVKELLGKTIQRSLSKIFEAIDQLPVEPQGKDCVERKGVLEFVESLFSDAEFMRLSAPAKKPVMLAGLTKLSSVQPVRQARSDEEIKKAIETLEKCFTEMKTRNHPWGSYWDMRRNINLLKYVLNQPQEEGDYPGSTWTNKELLGEEVRKMEEKPDEKVRADTDEKKAETSPAEETPKETEGEEAPKKEETSKESKE